MLGFFNELRGFFRDLQKLIWPATWDSWKTLVWISIYSWLMALITNQTDWIHRIIAGCGWVFLIAGVHWAMHDKPFKESLTIDKFFIGPWITGALICYFLFGGVGGAAAPGLVLWPPVSATIAAVPKFIGSSYEGPVYKPPAPKDRQNLVILFLINFLVSCWFVLHFLIQDWLAAYPDLRSQDLSRSPFVFVISGNNRPTSRGVMILDQAAALVQANLNGRPWSEVERWLLKSELPNNIATLEQQVRDRISDVEENDFWRLNGEVLTGSEYDLQLRAIWVGPSQAGGYYLTKTCHIRQISNGPTQTVTPPIAIPGNDATLTTTGVARVTCGPTGKPIPLQPNALINQPFLPPTPTPAPPVSPAPAEIPARKW